MAQTVDMSPRVDIAWRRVDGCRLQQARESEGVTQGQCAVRLVEAFGAPSRPSQSAMHNWEHHRTPRGPSSPEMRAAVRAYSTEVLGPETDASPVEELPADEVDAEFELLTGTTPLSASQKDVVEHLLARLHAGPPLSPDDTLGFRAAFKLVGLTY